MLLIDLIKIYNLYYILITEILGRYKKGLNLQEMERAFKMYKDFINFSEIVKREANSIPMIFGFPFKSPNMYVPDGKLLKNLEKILEQKRGGREPADFDDEVAIERNGGDDYDYGQERHQFDKDDEDSGEEDLDGVDILSDV
jgi:hypothetical protein